MKKIILAAAAAALSTTALAADLKVPPPVMTYKADAPSYATWQGLYFDGYLQYGANITDTTLFNGTGNFVADLASAPHGPGVGGALGYNFDSGTFVFGVRADISYLNMSGSGQAMAVTPNATLVNLSVSNATNYLGNLDILVGLPLGDRRLMVYGVGGLGFGGAKPNLQVSTLQQAASDTSTGWNVGAGLRYLIDQHLGLFIEGDYYQLGDKSLTAALSDGTVIATSTAKYHIITQKGGVTWKF
jgi:outer membrane immunogenic protein